MRAGGRVQPPPGESVAAGGASPKAGGPRRLGSMAVPPVDTPPGRLLAALLAGSALVGLAASGPVAGPTGVDPGVSPAPRTASAVEGATAEAGPAESSDPTTSPTEGSAPGSAPAPGTDPDRPVDFLRDVRPILAERCLLCHGNDGAQGGVRLHTFEDATADLGGYAAVVPGDAEDSELLWRVRAEDESERMPPPDHDDALTAEEVRILERWIADGADWQEHWAFAPLELAAPPELGVPPFGGTASGAAGDGATTDEPGVAGAAGASGPDPAPSLAWAADWLAGAADPTNPVDPWVRAGLVERGLAPAPDAGDLTWLRRASFDLVGLPPTPAEQVAFLADPPAERRARAADRLLASPHFGERWARHVLDLVRYAETRGHEFDFAIPNAWEYRDYLVRALNADVGWDQLVREHVAGDLLPEPRLSPEGWNESVLGTGFWQLGEAVHAPVDLEVDLADRTANQLDVFGKAFLGLTLACARCHDHKFDPIPTRDYYALSGYVQSASHAQVRFETIEAERALRADLDRLDARDGDAVLEALRARMRGPVEATAAPRAHAAGLEGDVEAARARRSLFEFEPGADGLAPTWGALGWTVEGAAFGDRPMTRATKPAWYGHTAPDGEGFVNSHDGRQAPDSPAADALTGRLVSPAFALDRDRLTLLIAGGSHVGETEVRLVVDGEVVRTATGHDAGDLREAAWDLTGLRGREARLELVDAATGGWGHLVVDAVRLEDAPDVDALAAARAATYGGDAALLRAWYEHRLARAAERGGDGAARADAGSAGADTNTDGGDDADGRATGEDAGSGVADGSAAAGTTAPDAAGPPRHGTDPQATTLWLAERDAWWQDGAAWTARPANGAWLTGDPERPVVAFAPAWWASDVPTATPRDLGAVGLDPAWRGLARAEVTATEATQVNWDGAGRTLRLPTWTLGEGSLWYLVRGKGVAFAAVEGHRVLSGPLHVPTALRFDTGETWRWVEHGHMAGYTGLRAHLELAPDGADAWVGIAAVAQGAAPPFFAPGTEDLLESVLANPALAPVPPPPGPLETAYHGARADLGARVPKVSRTAPALLDGNAVDQPVLVRGLASSPGEPAPRGYLVRFRDEDAYAPTHLADGTPTSGRLELATSMLERSGPLVARTFANRVWLQLMGRGLVPTPDNLGTLAAYPSHPELLDALALELVEHDWSLKHLARVIVLSRTYGLAAGDAGPDLVPRLDEAWGRRGPKRLDAEAVRDAILVATGGLDPTVGGPPVPAHLTEAMSGRGRPAASGPLDGAGRRSLYLEVRRNFLLPFQLVWDFPQPATTMGKRSRSNVPAQALALMNDPFVVLAAERWAARTTDEMSADELEPGGVGIDRLWREALGRPPRDAERDHASAWLRAADALSPRGDVSALEEHRREVWTDLCHAVLQLKEFVHVP